MAHVPDHLADRTSGIESCLSACSKSKIIQNIITCLNLCKIKSGRTWSGLTSSAGQWATVCVVSGVRTNSPREKGTHTNFIGGGQRRYFDLGGGEGNICRMHDNDSLQCKREIWR